MTKPLVYIVCGPTASGKTDMGIGMALRMNGEVVSCDSMQVYKYLDIGTGKPTVDEMRGIPHHLMSFLEPHENYSVAQYKADAERAIRDILSRGKTPIVVGGTGQYVSALVDNIEYGESSADQELRDMLRGIAEREGNEALHGILEAEDPLAAARIPVNDVKRAVRAIEIKRLTGESILEAEERSRLNESPFDFDIRMPDISREELYDRINRRVDRMVERGLIDETRFFMSLNLPPEAPCAKAIAYKEMAAYIRGEQSLDEAKEFLKQKTRNYAKRQLTWFRNKVKYHF